MNLRILVIALLLVLSGLVVIAGAAVAATGPASSGTAKAAQYGGDRENDDDDDDEEEEEEERVDAVSLSLGLAGPGPPAPDRRSAGAAPGDVGGEEGADVQREAGEGVGRADQVAGLGAGQLPFTGWSAILVLAVGLVLLSLGVIARRRLSQGDTSG